MEGEIRYIPPLVSGNKFNKYPDIHSTLGKANLNVGGYIRISTKKDAQKTSIENQKKILTDWANVNGYNLMHFYTDIKSGGYTYLRDDLLQLREDIKSGKVSGIVTKEISRTSRDIMDILELKRNLADYGAFFISIKENYDSRTDDDEFLLIIHAGLAQKERKVTASRVKVTQMLKAKEGKTNVASPAYGYKLTHDGQYLMKDPEKVDIYRTIVEKFLDGWGQLKICQYLNSKGIPPKRGDKWHTNSIKTILTNPVYLGVTIYNATTLIRDSSGKQKRVVRPESDWVIKEGTHEPLISSEEFNKIQDIVKSRKEKDNKEWSCEKKYLLSGLLYCNVCKGKVYGGKQPSKAKEPIEPYYYYYVDQNRYGTCDTKSKYWDMRKVDKLVLEHIKTFFTDKNLVEERIKANQHLFDKNQSEYQKLRNELISQIKMLESAVDKQQDAFEKGVLNMEEYRARMTKLREKKDNLNRKLETINSKLKKSDRKEEKYNYIKSIVIGYIENIEKLDFSLKETLLRKIIKAIHISQDYSLKIEYTFDD
jgi:DNA invertase Pin-like site-specific DNA recombinase